MKKNYSFIAIIAIVFSLMACREKPSDYRTYDVEVELITPDISTSDLEGVKVSARAQGGTEHKATTNAAGIAKFQLPEDVYSFTASHKISVDGTIHNVNYQLQRSISKQDAEEGVAIRISIEPVVSQGSKQIIIKEIYTGGCQKDDGSGNYQFDKYVVVYNNSDQVADIKNFCISNVGPYNAHAPLNNYVNGSLTYAEEDYTPAYAYLFYLNKNLVMQPYSSAVIALCGAIDHTATYSNSVDLSKADYVCYDVEDFWNSNYHPTPSEFISSDNYMLASKYCSETQNAAAWSVSSPGIFIFSAETDPLLYSQDPNNRHYMPGYQDNPVFASTKIPNDWIFDAVDVWSAEEIESSLPRYSNVLESGFVGMTNQQGYTIYRNVDKEATEALPENEGKLVYNYSLGTTDYQGGMSTDPSGIDAEASMANGAHIIFMDSNNSSNDFHQRSKSSLKF